MRCATPDDSPANWWDDINYGHEDAYSNALAYRAWARWPRRPIRSAATTTPMRWRKAAQRLKAAYFKTFFNPATGVLAGWRSADGQLHDYYFPYVSGIAIDYGLVPARPGRADHGPAAGQDEGGRVQPLRPWPAGQPGGDPA